MFDTLASSRKAANGRANPRVALVIAGWNDNEPRTIQYEGVVDFPVGTEPERLKQMYFAVFPDGSTRLYWRRIPRQFMVDQLTSLAQFIPLPKLKARGPFSYTNSNFVLGTQ